MSIAPIDPGQWSRCTTQEHRQQRMDAMRMLSAWARSKPGRRIEWLRARPEPPSPPGTVVVYQVGAFDACWRMSEQASSASASSVCIRASCLWPEVVEHWALWLAREVDGEPHPPQTADEFSYWMATRPLERYVSDYRRHDED